MEAVAENLARPVDPLLRVEGLRVSITRGEETCHPVDGVTFHVDRCETVGMVGESGCGKSLTALSLLRLLPRPAASLAAGRADFDGQDLFRLPLDQLRRIRGRRVGMIFQEPMTSLNPVFPCGEQVAEGLRTHLGLSRRAASEHAVALLDEVGIDQPARRAGQYPHELSGGMRQRVMIAIAIGCGPELLVADEPTTALDVTVQARILELLAGLQDSRGMSVLHITHDLGVIGERADRILVMYAGRVVEEARTDDLFGAPAHPYTLGLLACRPRLGSRRERLSWIAGQVPRPPAARPVGCAFHPRCPFATDRCRREDPSLLPLSEGHGVACFEAERVRRRGRWPDA